MTVDEVVEELGYHTHWQKFGLKGYLSNMEVGATVGKALLGSILSYRKIDEDAFVYLGEETIGNKGLKISTVEFMEE